MPRSGVIKTIKETRSACLIQTDELPNYYAFRVRDPEIFLKGKEDWASRPGWSIPITESVSKGSYIVTARLKEGNHDWKAQSVRILKKGKTLEQARKLALQIIEKLERRNC